MTNISNQLMDNTYNIVSFNCKNVKRSKESIKELCQSCDIIALQETWLLPEEISYLNSIDIEFGSTGTSAVDTSAGMLVGRPYGGVAILWRKTVFKEVSVLHSDNPRVCAIKVVSNKRTILVMSVYMPTERTEHLVDFTDCLGLVSAIIDIENIESVFVLGDFNSHPGGLFFSELTHFCTEHELVCVDVDRLGMDSGSYTFISEAHGTSSWLDHCLVTKSAFNSVTNVRINYDTLWSDHFPLQLKFKFDAIEPLSDLYYTHNHDVNCEVKWGDRNFKQIQKYREHCHKQLRLIDFPYDFIKCGDNVCDNLNHKKILDEMYCSIVAALRTSAKASYRGNRQHRGKCVIGWNRHVREAHGMAKLRFQNWIDHGKPKTGDIYEAMCGSRKIFKSRLKWCQDHKEQIKMDRLATLRTNKNFASFWKETKQLNSRPGLPVSIDGHSDPKNIANKFKEHFFVRSPLGPSISLLNTGPTGDGLNLRISATAVAQVIRQMSRGKSPGHDGLSIEHLQYAGPHIARVLAMFYSLCISHSYLPEPLMKTIVVPIVKNKTGDISDINNYRPISLATIVAKVLDSVLDAQLAEYIALHDNQFGFRSQLSTESAILCMKHAVKYYTRRGTPVYACFLDLSKAFDLVCYDILWRKLQELGLPFELINILKYWYSNQSNNVRWAGTLSDPYKMECGVRQGGLSSPRLFNLYINALIAELSSRHVGCHIDDVCVNNLSYADDMVLLSASVCGIRKLLGICESYANSHGLIYNVQKSKYVVFKAGSRCPATVPPIKLNGDELGRVHQFRYLGHLITEDLKDDTDIERERRALSVRANMIARRFARCTDEVKITLFRAFCTSFYTCSLWAVYTQKSFSALRVQYNNALRAMLRLPRHCSASRMFAEARIDCFYATLRKRCASMLSRVRSSRNSVLGMIAGRLDCLYMGRCIDAHMSVDTSIHGSGRGRVD